MKSFFKSRIVLTSSQFCDFVKSGATKTAAEASSTENLMRIFFLPSRCCGNSASSAEDAESTVSSEDAENLKGLNSALARKGIVVSKSAFQNLRPSELRLRGATLAEPLSGVPVYSKGHSHGNCSEITKAQFSRLLKQVTAHLSSIPDIFVQDGAIGSLPRFDAKVRVISDSPSAVLSFFFLLWRTPTRAVSHDSCPLTVYVASSISSNSADTLSHGSEGDNGFIAADTDWSSLILWGKAFSDLLGTKEALAALAGRVVSSRGGVLLPARLLVCGDSVVLLFAPENTVRYCSDLLISPDAGVILSSEGVSPLYQYGNSKNLHLLKLPAAVIFASSDSSGVMPPVSKLSPGQAAYHFLAGYQDGKFIPGYSNGLSFMDPLKVAKALFSRFMENQISSFLINANEAEKQKCDFVSLVLSTLNNNIPAFRPSKGGDLRARYKSFLSIKFQDLPGEFSF